MDASGSLCEKMLVYGETPSNNCIRIELKILEKETNVMFLLVRKCLQRARELWVRGVLKLGELHLGYNSPTSVMGINILSLWIQRRIGTRWLYLQYRFSAFSLHIKGNKISEFVLLHRLMKGWTRSETPSNNLS